MMPFHPRPWRLTAILLPAMLALALPVAAGEIHDAVAAGDQARVAGLLAADPTLASQPRDNPTRDLPLHTAAEQGNVEMARLLLDAGADIDGYDSDESTPLDVAALRRHREMVSFLIQRGADVNRRDKNLACPISFAAFGGDSTIVRMLVDAGSDLNFRSTQGTTLLHAAGLRGNLWLMDLIARRDGEIDVRTPAGETPLYWAARGGQTAAVKHLIELGANPALPDTFGRTPLDNAVMGNQVEVVRVLLEKGVDLDQTDRNGETALIMAAVMGREEPAALLIARGADVNRASTNGNTALSGAVQRGNRSIAQALLEAGAKVDVIDARNGRTPLHTAALHGHRDLAEVLLDHGASHAAQDADGKTPVELATRYGHRGVVDLLAGRGAEAANAPQNDGLTASGTLAAKEMKIWNLGHSGWAIQTANHLLIFDYAVVGRPADEPALCNGFIAPEEIAAQNVTVFVSHEHPDHFDPTIFTWSDRIPRLTYVFGFTPGQANRNGLPETMPAHEVMRPRETRTIDGVKITTIESNDSGAGFFVEVDGVALFHAGDHANRRRDFSGPFKSEIEFLASLGVRPDVAFLPVSGCGFGDLEAVRLGDYFVLETLKPVVFLPMHAGDQGWVCRRFVDACGTGFPGTELRAMENRGDCLNYRNGKTS
jgi:ankyrin repeat protein/L-ascorbate metabolism protein UlaG (beta-lactamase superfamily)